ncbi:MAG: DUF58 domain-containing protein [Chloroflexi bacterium]|nr:DUF58 domain-containing protein [Chloroflexota bacterium]
MRNRRNALYFSISACLIAGLLTGRAFFFNLAYLLGAMILVSMLWAWFSIRWIGITRRTSSSRSQIGRRFDEMFLVQNRAVLPKLWLEIHDDSDLPAHRASHVVPWLTFRASYRWYVETTCQARGEFRLGSLSIISGDPFGLFLLRRNLAATSRLVVYPLTVPIVKFAIPSGALTGGEHQRQRAHFITTNAVGVREYVTGDSFNRIHWPTTARRNQLMVKEFEIEPKVDVWLFVDFSASSLAEFPGLRRANGTGAVLHSGTTLPPSSEEYAVTIAASLAQFFIESDRAVGFAAYTPNREVLQPEHGARQSLRVMEILALARSVAQRSLAEMLALETPYISRGATLVLITASSDPAWIAEAQLIARKGIRPVCVLLEPQSFGGPAPVDDVRTMLRLANIPTFIIRCGDDLTAVLAQTPI